MATTNIYAFVNQIWIYLGGEISTFVTRSMGCKQGHIWYEFQLILNQLLRGKSEIWTQAKKVAFKKKVPYFSDLPAQKLIRICAEWQKLDLMI